MYGIDIRKCSNIMRDIKNNKDIILIILLYINDIYINKVVIIQSKNTLIIYNQIKVNVWLIIICNNKYIIINNKLYIIVINRW